MASSLPFEIRVCPEYQRKLLTLLKVLILWRVLERDWINLYYEMLVNLLGMDVECYSMWCLMSIDNLVGLRSTSNSKGHFQWGHLLKTFNRDGEGPWWMYSASCNRLSTTGIQGEKSRKPVRVGIPYLCFLLAVMWDGPEISPQPLYQDRLGSVNPLKPWAQISPPSLEVVSSDMFVSAMKNELFTWLY